MEILQRRRSPRVVTLRGSRFVFPAAWGDGPMAPPNKHLQKLRSASAVPGFIFHGIRHTLRARFARLGVAPHVSERVLGHALVGMEAQYTATGVEFIPEMRKASRPGPILQAAPLAGVRPEGSIPA